MLKKGLCTFKLLTLFSCSSGVVWEMKRRQKWKPFNQRQINLLEQAYKKYLCKSAFQASAWHKVDDNTEVCFEASVFKWLQNMRNSYNRLQFSK